MEEQKKDVQFDVKLSEDARVIKQIGPWTFYISKSQNSLFLETTDYHTGPLKITETNLSVAFFYSRHRIYF